MQFNYLSLQTLYDRYFIHDKGVRYELPQAFFMRVPWAWLCVKKIKKLKLLSFIS